MSNVVNRETNQYLTEVNTPDFDPLEWIINPDLSLVKNSPQKYWKVSGESVVLMTAEEQDAVNAADLVVSKKIAINALDAQVRDYVDALYSPLMLVIVSGLYAEALGGGPSLANQLARSQLLLAFLRSISDYRDQLKAAINVAPDAGGLNQIMAAIDIRANSLPDPRLSVTNIAGAIVMESVTK